MLQGGGRVMHRATAVLGARAGGLGTGELVLGARCCGVSVLGGSALGQGRSSSPPP